MTHEFWDILGVSRRCIFPPADISAVFSREGELSSRWAFGRVILADICSQTIQQGIEEMPTLNSYPVQEEEDFELDAQVWSQLLLQDIESTTLPSDDSETSGEE